MKLRLAGILSICLIPAFTVAQEAAPASDAEAKLTTGPPAGTEATTVMAYAPVGPHAGEEFDAAAAIGKKPGALLFIHELTRNGLPVIRGLDQIGTEFDLAGFQSFTFLLSDDRTAAETKLKAVNGSLKLRSPVVLSLDGMDGPGNYALNRKAVLSLILLNDGIIQKSIAFTDVNAEDSKLVRKLIAEVSGPLPNDPAALRKLAESQLPDDPESLRAKAIDLALELHRLRAENTRLRDQASGYNRQQRPSMSRGGDRPEMRRGAGRPATEKPESPENSDAPAEAKREGKPPEDPELNALLRAFIRQDATGEKVDGVFADITARAGESDELRAEAIEMFKLMLSFRDRYGTEKAQKLAEQFLSEKASN